MIVLSDTRFDEHVTPPGHPERHERAHVMSAVARVSSQGGAVLLPRAATRDQLALVHDPEYLDRTGDHRRPAAMLDADTFTSPETSGVALLAAGATGTGSRAGDQAEKIAFAFAWPPGHHAERDKAMGFCLYNNAAVAAACALTQVSRRMAIVDIDVHHGNGTQWIFYDEPRVLYISSHQFPFYPGTGAADETGYGTDGDSRSTSRWKPGQPTRTTTWPIGASPSRCWNSLRRNRRWCRPAMTRTKRIRSPRCE